MRFLLPILVGGLLVVAGFFLQGKNSHSLALSVSHRSFQRLLFDEIHLKKDKKWRAEEVSGTLDFAGHRLRVLMSALPTQTESLFSAVEVQVDEDQGVDQRDMVLVRTTAPEAEILLRPPSPAPLARGELIVNGKSAGEYALFAHPFTSTLQDGEGPLARRGSSGIEVSRQSRRLSLLVELAKRHEKDLPALDESAWAVWMPTLNQWRVWGHWPKEWSL